MAGDRDDLPQASPEGLESVGILMMAESRSDRTVGKEQRMMKTVKRTSKMRGSWDFANLRSMIKEAANPIQSSCNRNLGIEEAANPIQSSRNFFPKLKKKPPAFPPNQERYLGWSIGLEFWNDIRLVLKIYSGKIGED